LKVIDDTTTHIDFTNPDPLTQLETKFKEDLTARALEAQKSVAARREIDQRIKDSPVESDGSFLDLGESG